MLKCRFLTQRKFFKKKFRFRRKILKTKQDRKISSSEGWTLESTVSFPLRGPGVLGRGRRRSFRVESLILGSCTFLHGVGVLSRFSGEPTSRCS